MTRWRSVDSVTLVTDSDYDCGGKCVDKDDKEENDDNDDNWVIWWWREAALTVVTLLVVYQSCSQSPFASTIGFDLIGSNFYNLPPPSSSPLLSLSKQSNTEMKMTKWERLVCVL